MLGQEPLERSPVLTRLRPSQPQERGPGPAEAHPVPRGRGALLARVAAGLQQPLHPVAAERDPPVARALDALESDWTTSLAGPLDMGQLALACALGYLDFRHAARNWREGRPRLAAREARMADRPSLRDTAPA